MLLLDRPVHYYYSVVRYLAVGIVASEWALRAIWACGSSVSAVPSAEFPVASPPC